MTSCKLQITLKQNNKDKWHKKDLISLNRCSQVMAGHDNHPFERFALELKSRFVSGMMSRTPPRSRDQAEMLKRRQQTAYELRRTIAGNAASSQRREQRLGVGAEEPNPPAFPVPRFDKYHGTIAESMQQVESRGPSR